MHPVLARIIERDYIHLSVRKSSINISTNWNRETAKNEMKNYEQHLRLKGEPLKKLSNVKDL